MTQNTPVYGFPYPESTDSPNGPAQFQALALAIETVLIRMDSQSVQRQYITPGAVAWNKPAGLKGIYVWVTGAGGGGGGATTASAGNASPAAGGAGGSTAFAWIPASSLGASETVTVGAAGAAGTGSGAPTAGGAGGNSSFGALVVANGGSGGATAGSGTSPAFSSQSAYTPAVSGTVSPIAAYLGSIGNRGTRLNGTDALSGRGGAAGLGGGFNLDLIGQGNGSAGIIPGGGGAGGLSINGGGAANGGAGARGEVNLIEVY